MMNLNNPDRQEDVILSEAKDLCALGEILRFAQDDIPDFGR